VAVRSSSCWPASSSGAIVRPSALADKAIQRVNGASLFSRRQERQGGSDVAESADLEGSAAATLLMSRGGRRTFVPVARSFLQERKPGGGAAPLSWFVKTKRRRALDLYLLAHALASTEPYDVALPARTWALAIGLPDTASSRVSISTSFTWLEQRKLISSERDGRERRVWLLSESGSGRPYRHGVVGGALDYFKLPYAFWNEDWSSQLDLSATAVLLISLSLSEHFSMPQERGGQWYGISRDTVRRGLATLVNLGLLTSKTTYRTSVRSPTGLIEQRRYTLTGPFARQMRPKGRAPASPSAAA
jgi:hypothetical protein